jgi:hypothetical protein
MFEKIAKVAKNKNIKMLIFGYAGVGKTMFSLSQPGDGYMINFENGIVQYADLFPNLQVTTISKWQQFVDAIDYIANNAKPNSFLVIDSETAYWDQMLYDRSEYERNGIRDVNVPNFADWGVLKKIDANIHQKIKNLNMNVVAIAHEKPVVNSSEYVSGYVPACNKALPYMFDVTVRMTKDFDGTRKLFVENRHGNWLMKDVYDVTNKTFYDIFKDELGLVSDMDSMLQFTKIKISFCKVPEDVKALFEGFVQSFQEITPEIKDELKEYAKMQLKKLV